MRRKKAVNFLKSRATVVTLSLCFVAAVALVGMYWAGNRSKDNTQDLVDLSDTAEEQLAQQTPAPDTAEAATNHVVNEEVTPEATPTPTPEAEETVAEVEEPETEPEEEEPAAQTNAKVKPSPSFNEEDKIAWPVTGNVLMDYSMDKSIYFSTLDQYKYNPALIIQGEVNSQVFSAAPGTVTSVVVSEETGTTVTVDLGNGFEAIYGQLKEVPVEEGSNVKEGEIIGYISEPTKYYSVEGSNLFFEMRKDGAPVDPMNYLE